MIFFSCSQIFFFTKLRLGIRYEQYLVEYSYLAWPRLLAYYCLAGIADWLASKMCNAVLGLVGGIWFTCTCIDGIGSKQLFRYRSKVVTAIPRFGRKQNSTCATA